MRWLFQAIASVVVQTDNNKSYRTQITILSFCTPFPYICRSVLSNLLFRARANTGSAIGTSHKHYVGVV